jgi:acetoin utilization deacetylase AcuC-like enzyme
MGTPHPIFCATAHREHHPLNHPDVPARADVLLAAALAAGWSPAEPTDWGEAPLAAVHSAGLLAFLPTAYDRFALLKEGPRPAIPDSFAVRQLAEYEPSGFIPPNIWGQLGHYCTDDLTPILPGTWAAAYGAAQAALSAAAAVAGGAPLAYALCRPPGHHAYHDLYGGYCYLNNAAIAAQWLVERGRRPAILDVDYHHGNGTQAIFYERADVFFCSLHADPAEEYPYFCGFAHETGRGAGQGYTLNLPLPLDCDALAYGRAFERGLTAIAEFAPDVLVLSLGFDTLAGDPHGGMLLEVTSFHGIGRLVAGLGQPVVIIQEGGYLLPALGPALAAFLAGIKD